MPNHVKNRITLEGNEDLINELLVRYKTHHPQKPSLAYNGEQIYKHSENGAVGWLHIETGVFTTRDKDGNNVEALMSGFEPEFDKAFDQVLDFNKIIPMPESLGVESGSLGEVGYTLITKKSTSSWLSNHEALQRAENDFKKLSDGDKTKAMSIGEIYVSNEKLYGHKTWYTWATDNWGTKWNAYDCEIIDNHCFEFDTAWSPVINLVELVAKEYPTIKITYEWADEDTGANTGYCVFHNDTQIIEKFDNLSNEAYELAFKLRPRYRDWYELVDGSYRYKDE